MLTKIEENIQRNEGSEDFDKRHIALLKSQLSRSIARVTGAITGLCGINMRQEDVQRDALAENIPPLRLPNTVSVAALRHVTDKAASFSHRDCTRAMAVVVC